VALRNVTQSDYNRIIEDTHSKLQFDLP